MKCVFFFSAVFTLLLLQRAPAVVEAATCDPTDLTVCAAAILTSTPPTSACCAMLKSQVACFCQYKNDPTLSGYVSSGKQVAAACGIPYPNC